LTLLFSFFHHSFAAAIRDLSLQLLIHFSDFLLPVAVTRSAAAPLRAGPQYRLYSYRGDPAPRLFVAEFSSPSVGGFQTRLRRRMMMPNFYYRLSQA